MRLRLRYSRIFFAFSCLLMSSLVLLGGCSRDETGLLVSVTIDPADEATLDGNVDELVFYVAVSMDASSSSWVLDRRATGHRGEVSGRRLLSDPYRLLVHEDGDGVMEVVRVAVVGYRGEEVVAWGTLEDPVTQAFLPGRIAERTIALKATSRVDAPFTITDTGCILTTDGGVLAAAPDDRDCDGALADVDCNDEDPTIGPQALEICDNGVDDNCNGTVDEVEDKDNDGYTNCEPVDCDDENPDVHPGADEVCDGLDNDCDGLCDAGFDQDGDGWTDCGDGTGGPVNADGTCGAPPDAAGWDCVDGSSEAYPGGTEVCDGLDNDCNGETDEGLGGACYDGPAGTAGTGLCREGQVVCVNGGLSPCEGQILPAPETCNGQDDDCDGEVDEGTVLLSCGIGACHTTVPSCVDGAPQTCTPLAASTEICDGIDNNCDGVVDEGCGCIHVAPYGASTNTGGQNDPMDSISAAIARAVAHPSGPQQVCVAADSGCTQWTIYSEAVVMADGVQVLGQFDPSSWTRRASCRTEIQAATFPAVTFPVTVVNPTALDGFVVSFLSTNGATESSAMRIEGSAGAIVGNCEVYGSTAGDVTVGIDIVDDPQTSVMAAPIIHHTRVEGGDGATLSIGIRSVNSMPAIVDNCSSSDIDASGRCLGGCGSEVHIQGFRTGMSPTSVGVRLEASPGAVVDRSAVCTAGDVDGVGVQVVGDAAGTVISRSNIGIWGADDLAVGVALEDCAGAAPWIGDNHLIWAEGDESSATSTSIGIAATGDCHPIIEANRLITGGIEESSATTRGVLCGIGAQSGVASHCIIAGNTEIIGSSQGLPDSSIGVVCEPGACGAIRNNQRISGRAGAHPVGLALTGASRTLVDSNIIEGGCATGQAIALLADNSSARVQNNVLFGGGCQAGTSTAPGVFIGAMMLLRDTSNELDLNSNAISGGGVGLNSCTSIGLYIDASQTGTPPGGGLGIIRNNLIQHGQCLSGYVVNEARAATDPRIFENNALVTVTQTGIPLYFDENLTALSSASDVNALTDIISSGNIDTAPGFSYSGNVFPVLGAGSPLRNAGTSKGAPAWDWEGDSRPQESAPDIGPDEYVP